MIADDFEDIRARLRDLRHPGPVDADPEIGLDPGRCPHQFDEGTERCVFCNLHRG